ncbi:MAG TPA: TonB C-terminal domain-containing protein [Vicinamibacterales bacterium]|jgi:TonB family protein|nr:TonB C-terminal domain-containing protein [Vicinamibacterales bacterium]
MYFDFEDYRPDVPTIGRVISVREGVLLAFIAHLVGIIFVLVAPRVFPEDVERMRARLLAQQQRLQDQARFVFVQPKLDRPAPKAPNRAELSDIDREAQSPKRAEKPTNPLPYNRGNSPERVEAMREAVAKGRGAQPDPAPSQQKPPDSADSAIRAPQLDAPLQIPQSPSQSQPTNATGRATTPGGSLGDALRNLQRYTQNQSFDNQGGGGGQFGPEIQFDTKGVEFGPWIRRFIAQVRRNWFIPYAAMSMKGHVVITFNVHKDGSISDLAVIGPCPIDSFNSAAFGALSASNPTQPLPPEYPSDKAFFTVTFFYNESPR